ncbi:helix-turn-helix domain-containing protein [Salipaludibacillus sp. CUR1]|uniref:helix-turn-helix domain-containing protein n=1 Tax=Salipaludibacillus sp. CUR1 TaxID=2820003 RepID=UPI001E5619AB|nr:helix-turn-helix domain-containing protein [Salipaludibacillus sp. CUR1]MCE7792820.1 helix-turn-helix domain-containing protein [Salipaludibacillus sp. CUR1]
MELYGPTLRKIRKQKGLSMKELGKGSLSVSFLSKFERGESDISLSLMNKLLTRLNISFDEFLFIYNNYSNQTIDSFFNGVNQAYMEQYIAKLEQLMEVEENRNHLILLELYSNILKNENSDDLQLNPQTLFDYLFSVEVWGDYELKLYRSTMLLMNPEMVLNLSHTAFKKGRRYHSFKDYKNVMASIYLNTIIYLIGPVNKGDEMVTKYEEDILKFFSYIEDLKLDEHETHLRINVKYINGIYMIKKGQVEEGTELVNNMISILRDLNCENNASDFERFLELILKGRESKDPDFCT